MPSPDEYFNQAIDDYKAGKAVPTGTLFDLGRTPYLGGVPGWLSKVPVMLGQGVIRKAAEGKHDLDLRGLYNFPSRLASPVAIFDSATIKGSFVVLTNAVLAGEPVVAIYLPTQNQRLGSFMSVRSIHTRPPAQFGYFEEKGLLRYLDATKRRPW